MEWSYITPKGTETFFTSEEMRAKKALLIAEDIERTGRVKQLDFIDQHDNHWNIKQLRKYTEEIQTEAHDVKVFFDGGFDVKTKVAGLGCVIYYEQNNKQYRLRKNAFTEGLYSNNEAEYAALHLAVKELEILDVHHQTIKFVGDSLVVINQMNDEWPCYDDTLIAWMDRIEKQLERLGISPEYAVISRKNNREADQLATQALNKIEITSTKELE